MKSTSYDETRLQNLDKVLPGVHACLVNVNVRIDRTVITRSGPDSEYMDRSALAFVNMH